ncbi:hypothetical protein OIU84_010707 [Salix udensis]|uniref:Ultraviolet-B-repressible protein n=1 Tax=Salix udensis TaxID=889485 RepID=A0AAD6JLD1_9ROSI|nr:hypothetical protein OIU84_010707 [Salix udensis]
MTSLPDISNFHLSLPLSPPSTLEDNHYNNIFTNYIGNFTEGKLRVEKREQKQRPEKQMASTSAVSMALPLTYAGQKRVPASEAFFKPLPARPSKAMSASKSNGRFQVKASLKEKVVTGLTAGALTASMVIPDVAEAAGAGVSPSLKNFLLSIAAGGVVLVAIIGAVIGVSNFDPVRRS